MQVIAVIDIGTSSSRFAAYESRTGSIVCQVQIHHSAIKTSDKYGDAMAILKSANEAIDQGMKHIVSLGGYTVEAMGFSVFGMNLCGVDEAFQQITPLFTYSGGPLSSDTIRLPSKADLSMHALVGARLGHTSYLPEQLRVYVSNGGTVAAVTDWTSISSLLLRKWITAERYPLSCSEASWTGVFDYVSLAWSIETNRELRDHSSYTSWVDHVFSTLPPVVSKYEPLPYHATEKWGEAFYPCVCKDMKIFPTLIDGAAATLGTNCWFSERRIAVTVGRCTKGINIC